MNRDTFEALLRAASDEQQRHLTLRERYSKRALLTSHQIEQDYYNPNGRADYVQIPKRGKAKTRASFAMVVEVPINGAERGADKLHLNPNGVMGEVNGNVHALEVVETPRPGLADYNHVQQQLRHSVDLFARARAAQEPFGSSRSANSERLLLLSTSASRAAALNEVVQTARDSQSTITFEPELYGPLQWNYARYNRAMQNAAALFLAAKREFETPRPWPSLLEKASEEVSETTPLTQKRDPVFRGLLYAAGILVLAQVGFVAYRADLYPHFSSGELADCVVHESDNHKLLRYLSSPQAEILMQKIQSQARSTTQLQFPIYPKIRDRTLPVDSEDLSRASQLEPLKGLCALDAILLSKKYDVRRQCIHEYDSQIHNFDDWGASAVIKLHSTDPAYSLLALQRGLEARLGLNPGQLVPALTIRAVLNNDVKKYNEIIQ